MDDYLKESINSNFYDPHGLFCKRLWERFGFPNRCCDRNVKPYGPCPVYTFTNSFRYTLPTNTYTATPELGIAPNCRIANEEGQLYLLNDQEFRDLRTTDGKLDRALAAHDPEWAKYAQTVPWSTQPVK